VFDQIAIRTNDPVFDIDNLLAATLATNNDGDVNLEHSSVIDEIFDVAIANWTNSGLVDAEMLARLDDVNLEIANLSGQVLGRTEGNKILLDLDAAGHGWFIDLTPEINEEFKQTQEQTHWIAIDKTEANDRMDLLTVLKHEIGHILDFNHGDINLMADTLHAGVRVTLATASTEEPLTNTQDINSPKVNTVASENKSFTQKLKNKLNIFSEYQFFDGYFGGFSSKADKTLDEEEDNEFIIFSNTEDSKDQELKGSRYDITEDKDEELFELADGDDDKENTSRTSALIDWSSFDGE